MSTPRTGSKKVKPIPLRFSEDMVAEIAEVSKLVAMDRSDVLRLACGAGLKILRKLERGGLAELIASQFGK